MNEYHCSPEGFHVSSAQQRGLSGGCTKNLWIKKQLTHLGIMFGKIQPTTELSNVTANIPLLCLNL